jgi:hypothetical protein
MGGGGGASRQAKKRKNDKTNHQFRKTTRLHGRRAFFGVVLGGDVWY